MKKSQPFFIILALALTMGAADAFTPVRRLSALKEQNPDAIVERAPESAQVVLPARYVKPLHGEIAGLQSLTNALWNGQILLQKHLQETLEMLRQKREELKEVRTAYEALKESYDAAAARAARLDALRTWLVEQRDAAKLPTTKAIYQAILDKLDEDIKGAEESATSLAS